MHSCQLLAACTGLAPVRRPKRGGRGGGGDPLTRNQLLAEEEQRQFGLQMAREIQVLKDAAAADAAAHAVAHMPEAWLRVAEEAPLQAHLERLREHMARLQTPAVRDPFLFREKYYI